MLRYILFAIALLIFLSIVVALIISLLIFVAFACAIGIPLWLMGRSWLRHHGVVSQKQQSPVERLQTLFVEGKIDLFEFEQRVARLVRVDQ